ncbi:MAG: flagellar basal body protein FliL [Alphaproteobacteria bacterium]|nr:flagellar basal body protein FliL [Alphaproteobacteria bacterium]NDC57209.1 flagellar basal body protein FliL [Alphaproteobacteria bacterium]NDG05569.1 flagellar basal body protein FliL [Alphaproteobacteria bacterium]
MAEKDKKAKDKEKDDDADKKEGDEGAEGDAGAEGEAAAKKGLPIKKIALFGGGAVVLIGAIVAGLFFSGVMGGKDKAADAEHAEAAAEQNKKEEEEKRKAEGSVFVDLGELLVNLQGDGRRVNYLKIRVSVELASEEDKAKFDKAKPRVLDNFQVYLRELRVEDLRGSAGIYRLREELLARVAEAAYPAKVYDVLFLEMLVQ